MSKVFFPGDLLTLNNQKNHTNVKVFYINIYIYTFISVNLTEIESVNSQLLHSER